MNRRQVMALAGASAASGAEPTTRERFLGVWKLARCERKLPGGRLEYPYGENPVGRITYDRAGRMSALLMRPGRRSSVAPGTSFALANASPEEIREAVSGFIAYFGKYDIDDAARIVIHHVEACLVPSWVGTDLKRSYRFEANRLFLAPGATANGSIELTWEREPD